MVRGVDGGRASVQTSAAMTGRTAHRRKRWRSWVGFGGLRELSGSRTGGASAVKPCAAFPRSEAPASERTCLHSFASHSVHRGPVHRCPASPAKQSFEEKHVTKLELGNEEHRLSLPYTAPLMRRRVRAPETHAPRMSSAALHGSGTMFTLPPVKTVPGATETLALLKASSMAPGRLK